MDLRPLLGLHDPVSSLSHFVAAASALVGAWFLYKKGRGDGMRTGTLLIFSASLLFLFAMSGTYHALAPGPWRVFFRRLDYAAIWIVIAGSATPVHALLLRGHWRWSLTVMFWVTALVCLLLIDAYLTKLPYWAIVSAYIGVSSLGVFSFQRISLHHGWRETTLLFLGGVAYAVGAIIDYLEGPVILRGILGPHELFHFLVIIGALLHWCFMYSRADGRIPAPADARSLGLVGT